MTGETACRPRVRGGDPPWQGPVSLSCTKIPPTSGTPTAAAPRGGIFRACFASVVIASKGIRPSAAGSGSSDDRAGGAPTLRGPIIEDGPGRDEGLRARRTQRGGSSIEDDPAPEGPDRPSGRRDRRGRF